MCSLSWYPKHDIRNKGTFYFTMAFCHSYVMDYINIAFLCTTRYLLRAWLKAALCMKLLHESKVCIKNYITYSTYVHTCFMILKNASGWMKAPNDHMGHLSLPLLMRRSIKMYRWFRSTTQSRADHDEGGEVGPRISTHSLGVFPCNSATAISASLSGHWSPSVCSLKMPFRTYITNVQPMHKCH